MATLDELLYPFAGSIYTKINALRRLDLTPKQRARFNESISDDIKKCSNFVAPAVSLAAQKRAKKLKPEVDLFTKTWHDQQKFDKGRKLFHLEHKRTVSAIRDSCLEASSIDDVFDRLSKGLRIVWILKSEDAELTRRTYRSRRPNPNAAYREAEIKTVGNPRR